MTPITKRDIWITALAITCAILGYNLLDAFYYQEELSNSNKAMGEFVAYTMEHQGTPPPCVSVKQLKSF